jgi:hypothetical protein
MTEPPDVYVLSAELARAPARLANNTR